MTKYKGKVHYEQPQIRPGKDRLSYCGKLLPPEAFTDDIREITCKVCRSSFRWWVNREDE